MEQRPLFAVRKLVKLPAESLVGEPLLDLGPQFLQSVRVDLGLPFGEVVDGVADEFQKVGMSCCSSVNETGRVISEGERQEAHGLHHRLDTVKLVKGTENNSRAEESADGVRRLASLRRKVLAREDEHVAGALKAEALEDVAYAREEIGPRAL